jgi:uncharacterized protein YbjT (DUF2867 family)
VDAVTIIIGGHGKVALLLHPLLASREEPPTAVIRNADHVEEVEAAGATALVADVERMDEDDLAAMLGGHDAVVWSAGAGGGSPERTYAVDRDAAIRTMGAAERAGARRFVMVSYFGAGPDHGVDPSDSFYAYAEAKTAADGALQRSDLDWTILRPSRLTLDAPTGRIDAAAASAGSVARADVAAVIDAVLQEPASVGRIIAFNTGDVSIAEAVRG